eukprot:SAG11_NODE_1397_length_5032_cov_14.008109_4_plen_92_part_00
MTHAEQRRGYAHGGVRAQMRRGYATAACGAARGGAPPWPSALVRRLLMWQFRITMPCPPPPQPPAHPCVSPPAGFRLLKCRVAGTRPLCEP